MEPTTIWLMVIVVSASYAAGTLASSCLAKSDIAWFRLVLIAFPMALLIAIDNLETLTFMTTTTKDFQC